MKIKAWAIINPHGKWFYCDGDGKGGRYWIYNKRINPKRGDEASVRVEIKVIKPKGELNANHRKKSR